MMGHKMCFYGEIWLIIPKLFLLPLLIWRADYEWLPVKLLMLRESNGDISFLPTRSIGVSSEGEEFAPSGVDPILKGLYHPRKQTGSHKINSPLQNGWKKHGGFNSTCVLHNQKKTKKKSTQNLSFIKPQAGSLHWVYKRYVTSNFQLLNFH